jgi:hypothetical protein
VPTITRRTSANRHNLNLHGNNGEIVGTIEYLAGVSSGQYKPVYPNEYRRRSGGHPLSSPNKRVPMAVPVPVVRDYVGDIWRLGGTQWHGRVGLQQSNPYLQQHGQPTPLPSPIPPLPSTSPGSTTQGVPTTPSGMSQPSKIGGNWGVMSEDTIPKFVQLKRLLYKHPDTFPNPDIIIQGAKHFCMMGDNSFLEEKLAYLRSVDAITHVEQPI